MEFSIPIKTEYLSRSENIVLNSDDLGKAETQNLKFADNGMESTAILSNLSELYYLLL